MDAAGELAQLVESLGELVLRSGEVLAGGRRILLELRVHQARSSATDTSRCCAPSCRLRSRRRRSASPASTIRARDAASSSCASAFAIACATSSAKSHKRRSTPSGSGSADRVPAASAPHSRPPTLTGAATAAR